MMGFLINVLLLQIFSLLVMVSVKGKRNVINALIIFHSLNIVKILFLCVWAMHKTGTVDLNYLQFPDEHYYLAEWRPTAVLSNLYHLAVIGMRSIGFSISNVKMVNILISSFAIVRLYTLKDLVEKKNQYVIHLYVCCGLLFLHMIYFSIFVLKDVIFLYVTAEFLIQLIRRSIDNRRLLIALLGVVLMLLRPPMVLGFAVFLFDRNWRLRWARVFLTAALGAVLVSYHVAHYRQVYYHLLSYGVRENAGDQIRDLDEGARVTYVENVVASRPSMYLRHIFQNVRSVMLPDGETDVTIQLILLLQWSSLAYLLFIKKGIRHVMQLWPIASIGLLYFIGGVLTLYNIRYNAFPATVALCLSVYAASQPHSCANRRALPAQ